MTFTSSTPIFHLVEYHTLGYLIIHIFRDIFNWDTHDRVIAIELNMFLLLSIIQISQNYPGNKFEAIHRCNRKWKLFLSIIIQIDHYWEWIGFGRINYNHPSSCMTNGALPALVDAKKNPEWSAKRSWSFRQKTRGFPNAMFDYQRAFQ